MSIQNQIRSAGPFVGNGVQTVFPFGFKVFQASDLAAVINASSGGAQTVLALTTDFFVTLNADQNVSPGGAVTTNVPVANGASLTLTSNVPLTQPAVLTNTGGFFPKVIENALDRLTILLQQLGFIARQTLRVPDVGGIPPLPAAAARANTSLGFDGAGNPMLAAALPPGTQFQFGVPYNDLLTTTGASSYALSANPGLLGNLQVFLGGVRQRPGIDYTWSPAAPLALFPVIVWAPGIQLQVYYSQALPIGVSDAGTTAFSYSASYLAGTVGRWLQDLATSIGTTLIGFLQQGVGALKRTLASKLFEQVSVLDFIPESEHAAIKAYNSTLEVSDFINAAIAAYPNVRLPAGGYFCTRPVNQSARRSAFAFWGRRLIGDGANSTRIYAYTGPYPCIDCTGQNTGEVSGIDFISDNPGAFSLPASACASIGLMKGRGAVSQSCNQLSLFDLRFNLTSDMTRNAGNGTIGILNNGAEHVIRDRIQIYANLTICDHNGLQFTPSFSSDIPTFGVNYEQPYLGSPISCTIHESRNMQLISWDSFRAMWLHQVANSEWPNLYTSTRKLLSSVPAFAETINLTGSCANVTMRGYQEVSGLFGATYRMDHAYLTSGGDSQNIDILLQRAALDQGFAMPGAPVASVRIAASSSLGNSRINCNYLIGTYNLSGDNNGFATLPVAIISGTPNWIRNTEFTLDRGGSHSAAIFSAIGKYCTNVLSKNYFTGDTRRCDGAANALNSNLWTPVALGLSSAGAGTYTFQFGTFERIGGWCFFSLRMAWSAHTGTGGLAISGLPFAADASAEQAVSVSYDTLVIGAGKQMTATIPNGQSRILLNQADIAGGALTAVQVDGTVAGLTLTGSYKIAD